MTIQNYTLVQHGAVIGSVAVRIQAVFAAKIRAKQTKEPVSVIANLTDGSKREVRYHPDGTVEKLWQKGGVGNVH